ncbi:hypothetical protein BGX28_001960 [Mortierella sp. GBA30]|nr:hypothetical protein BGX28_001960 [Mortierella sp. GBA30]
MQASAIDDKVVNPSAGDPCDVERTPRSTSHATLSSTAPSPPHPSVENGLNITQHPVTPETKLSPNTKAESESVQANTSPDNIDTLNGLEKGAPPAYCPSSKDNENPDSSTLICQQRPFLYSIRASKQFITLTILLALFTDMVTYGIIIPIMPSIIKDMGGDPTKTGVLVAVYAVGIMSASPIFGILSDKMASRRKPMIIGVSGLLIATILFMLAKTYWLLIFARFFQGVSGGAVWTLGLALMSDSFPASEMGIQMGKSLIGHTMGMLGGPPIGGLLHDAFGPKAPFYFCIAFAILVLFCLSNLIEVRADEVLEIRRYEAEIRERDIANGIEVQEVRTTTVWQLIMTKRMIAAVAVTTLEAFDLSSLEPTLPYYLRDRFDMTEGQIGLVFIAFTLPTIISPLAGWISDRYGAKILCSTAVFICGCLMLVLSIPNKPIWGIVLTLVGIGLSTSSFIAPILGEISAVVRRSGDKSAYARAFAIFNMSFSFGMVIGPIMAGYIYEKHGFRWNNITTACILFAFVPLLVYGMGDRKAKMEDVAMYEREEEERKRMLKEIELIKAEKKAAEEQNANTLV